MGGISIMYREGRKGRGWESLYASLLGSVFVMSGWVGIHYIFFFVVFYDSTWRWGKSWVGKKIKMYDTTFNLLDEGCNVQICTGS